MRTRTSERSTANRRYYLKRRRVAELERELDEMVVRIESIPKGDKAREPLVRVADRVREELKVVSH